MSMMPGQQSLTNFYESVQFQNPAMAQLMSNDIRTVAIYSLIADKEPGYEAVQRLRSQALTLPAVQARVLDHALTDLGYELDVLYDV